MIAALRPHRVPWQIHHIHQAEAARPLRDSAGVVGRTVIDDDDFDRLQRLLLERSDCAAQAGAAVKGRYDYTDGSTAGGGAIVSCAEAEQRKRRQRKRIARDVEYQDREGEQEQAGPGEQLQHFEHASTSAKQTPGAGPGTYSTRCKPHEVRAVEVKSRMSRAGSI